MSKFFKTFDKIFSKVEKKGFKMANFLHKTTVNIIIIGIGYTVVTTGRDYNEIFREQRKREFIKNNQEKNITFKDKKKGN